MLEKIRIQVEIADLRYMFLLSDSRRSAIFMHIKAATLDDLLRKTFTEVLKSKTQVLATKGHTIEKSGVLLELTQPRSRLSRTETKGHIFSCLGEFLWYLSGSDKLDGIEYYLPKYKLSAENNGRIHGAYGPRIFGGAKSQYDRIKEILSQKKTSRQAVIQLFDKRDLRKNFKDTPCTCTLQFIVRNNVIHMLVHMRSNDAFKGLPHDVFSFTMIQELMARDLGFKVGRYKHMVGSLHIYDEDLGKVAVFLNEGLQSTRPMPDMPVGDPWPSIKVILDLERELRCNHLPPYDEFQSSISNMDEYWSDIARILYIYRLYKERRSEEFRYRLRECIEVVEKDMHFSFYISYIKHRRNMLHGVNEQLELWNTQN